MTAPHKKYLVTPEIIHHTPTVIAPPDTTDRYPVNQHFPPDPAIYAPVIAYDCEELGK